jgi:hypothetical protein
MAAMSHLSLTFLPWLLMPAGQSSPLSPHAKDIYSALLNASKRQDQSMAEGGRLQLSCFEAINDMVRATTADVVDTVSALIPIFIQDIGQTLMMSTQTGEAREKQRELQAQYCGVLQVSRDVRTASEQALLPVLRAFLFACVAFQHLSPQV